MTDGPPGGTRRATIKDVAKALNGVRPHLMVTDPPYGVNYDPGWRENAGLTDGSVIAKGKVLNLQTAVKGVSIPFHPGAVKYYKEKGLMK